MVTRLSLAVLLSLSLAASAHAGEAALDWLVGTWDTRETFPESGFTARGTVAIRWTLDGRFLYEEYSSTWPDGPIRGHGYTKWDRESGSLDFWWFDTTGAGQHSRCAWDGQGPRVFLTVDGGSVLRETYTRTGPDGYTYRLERDDGPGWRTVMDLVATRRP